MRYDSGGSGNGFDNSDFFRTENDSSEPSSTEKQKIWLSLVNENNSSTSALIGYANDATLGKDNLYDALGNGGDFGIYSLVEGDRMVIQGRPSAILDVDNVPLSLKINTTGIYDIAIDHLEGSVFITDAKDIYLEDTFLNMVHDLRQSPYSFTAEAGIINDRFILRYSANQDTLSTQNLLESDTFIFVDNDVLKAKSSQNISKIDVYTLNGKRLISYDNLNNSEFNQAFSFSKGVYLASIKLENGSTITKKLIN